MKNFLKISLTCLAVLTATFILTNCKKDVFLSDPDVLENQNLMNPTDNLRKCAANDVYERMLKANPEYARTRRDIENFTEKYIQENAGKASDRTVRTIPVVVHVLWKTTAQNISDAQVLSQITVLNNDFRRLNADASNTPAGFLPIAADSEIEFCMAQQTPSGAATNGIERRQTTVTSFTDNDNMKHFSTGGLDAWDATKYLNIWVCNLGGGLLGYAQFPGGPVSTDGVVILCTAFGTVGTAAAPFNLGRTATHEVGHWLNLFHIWGDDGSACSGSDACADTPNQADEHYGCPSFPQTSCSNGSNGDMFMNYMDYTDDGCMNVFSTGQKTRMQALFSAGGARVGLLTSIGCQPPSGGCGTPGTLAAGSITTTSTTLSWGAVSGATSYNIQYKTVAGTTFTTTTSTTTSKNITSLTAATAYHFKVQAVCASGTGSYSGLTIFTTQTSGGGCTDNYETNNSNGTAKAIPVNAAITAMIGTSTDKDFFKFSNTTAQKKIKVTMTNLPADYDLYLFRGTTLVASSDNPGTANEEIIYNTNVVGEYKIRVLGYAGAFSSTLCYSLNASIQASNFKEGDGSLLKISGKQIPQDME